MAVEGCIGKHMSILLLGCLQSHDRHTLMTMLATYYTSSLVDDPAYKLSPSGLFFAPNDADYNGYVSLSIRTMALWVICGHSLCW